MTRLLDAYQDPVLEINLADTWETISAEEVETLQSALAVVTVTAAIPRRLGGDATREELALDKRRAKRVAHVMRQSLLLWGGKERPATDEERQAGAQMVWELWAEDCRAQRLARLRYLATWAKTAGQHRHGKSAVVRITQELEWLDYALRD